MILGFGGTITASSKCLKKEVPLLFTLLFKHFQWCPTINHPFLGGNMGKPHWLILFGDHDLSFSPPAPSCSEASVHHGPRRSPRTRFLIDSPSIMDFAWFCIGKITHQSHHLQQVQDSPTAPPPHLSGQRRSTPGPVRDTSSQLGSSHRLLNITNQWHQFNHVQLVQWLVNVNNLETHWKSG